MTLKVNRSSASGNYEDYVEHLNVKEFIELFSEGKIYEIWFDSKNELYHLTEKDY